MPSHYLNQCCNVINSNLRSKPKWNLKRNLYIFIQEDAFENVVCQNSGHFVQGQMSFNEHLGTWIHLNAATYLIFRYKKNNGAEICWCKCIERTTIWISNSVLCILLTLHHNVHYYTVPACLTANGIWDMTSICHHNIVIGWSKYGLADSSIAIYSGRTWYVTITTAFHEPLTLSLHALNGTHMSPIRLQRDCESF